MSRPIDIFTWFLVFCCCLSMPAMKAIECSKMNLNSGQSYPIASARNRIRHPRALAEGRTISSACTYEWRRNICYQRWFYRWAWALSNRHRNTRSTHQHAHTLCWRRNFAMGEGWPSACLGWVVQNCYVLDRIVWRWAVFSSIVISAILAWLLLIRKWRRELFL